MNIIFWIIFGMITGIIANLIDPQSSQGGIIGAVILGVGGALVGGLLANLVLGIQITGFDLPSFAIAIMGSLLLLFIGRAVRRI